MSEQFDRRTISAPASNAGGLRRPHRRAALASMVIVCCTGGAIVRSRAQAAHPAEPHRHADARQLTSPVAADAENLAAGKGLFQRFCASCHGPQGNGDGGMAVGGGHPRT